MGTFLSSVAFTDSMDGKKLIIFDKDGTLMDASPGSMKAVVRIAETMGKPVPSEDQMLKSFCGSFGHNIMWLLGLKQEEQIPAIMSYVKFYGEDEGYYDYKEYPGLSDTIVELSGKYMLSVATMMYTDFAEKALASMDIDGCFLTIRGVALDHWVSKVDLIRECMEFADVTPEETVMIGDSHDDMESARATGVDFIAVTYGYDFTEEECREKGIPYARTPAELLNIL